LMYYFLGGEGATNKHMTLLLLIYALAGLMVSTVPYYSFKDLHLRHRQPFWLLIVGIIVVQVTIAQPQLMLFSIFSLYTLSGPVTLLLRGRSTTVPTLEPTAAARGLDSDKESSL